jgi:16S rRNA U516 pseudouridylate synthase RsuA-like enzyme
MRIPLIKGRRREVRRLLAHRSHQLLRLYREGDPVELKLCPLQAALRAARPPLTATSSPSQTLLF